MDLHTQVITLIFSFGYGFFFSLLLDIIHNYLFSKKTWAQILLSFLFVMINASIYFIILLKLNNAILHPYYMIIFILGFFVFLFLKKKIVKRFKK